VVNRWKKRTWPHGLDVEVFTFDALEKAWEEAKDPFEREHVTPYILKHPELFEICEIPYKEDLSYVRLTVDYPEDLEFAEKVLSMVIPKYGMGFSWKDVMRILKENPELYEVNKNRVNPSL